MEQLRRLQGCEVHLTHIPTSGDEAGLRRLGVDLTCEPSFASKNLFQAQRARGGEAASTILGGTQEEVRWQGG